MKAIFRALTILVAALTACATGPDLSREIAISRPNFIFILADDLGFVDVSAYAVRTLGVQPADIFYETPHIDRLIREGLSFSRAYAQQLCSPTRASLLTGRDAARLGFTTASWHGRPTYHMAGQTPPPGQHPQEVIRHYDDISTPQAWINASTMTALRSGRPADDGVDEITIAEQLRDYRSSFLGKWHLGGHGAEGYQPMDQGFATIAWFDSGGSPYFDWRDKWNNKVLHLPTMAQDKLVIGDAGQATGREYLTDDLTDQALDYLDMRAADPGRPFFLYFNHFAVHGPWQARADDVAHFAAKPTIGWNGHDNAVYAAMIKSLDDSVGAIMQKLRETGLDKTTIVIFMSDNGGLLESSKGKVTSNAPLKGGKAMLYEGGIRVPLIFWGPEIIASGAWSEVAVHCTDLFPTISELAGYVVDHEIDGQSMVPLLRDPANSDGFYRSRPIYWHYPFNVALKSVNDGLPLTPQSSVIDGDWKLIFDWHGRLELYNLADDLSECHNLADACPGRAEAMFHQLKSWLKDNIQPQYFPIRNPQYDPALDPRPSPFRDLWTR